MRGIGRGLVLAQAAALLANSTALQTPTRLPRHVPEPELPEPVPPQPSDRAQRRLDKAEAKRARKMAKRLKVHA